ncbi:hypothetical protein M0813_17068 [Anaeramoeba flamelloides]|uniref:RRM domain-containing protein n=1 Tax=Anaeramoeba flamelloides TaxID=1746091 RepID=A0ABQ8YYK4_9EUKA|nr:hypothetical protein M0813_17068 [Anaeramoeba flamelloides]
MNKRKFTNKILLTNIPNKTTMKELMKALKECQIKEPKSVEFTNMFKKEKKNEENKKKTNKANNEEEKKQRNYTNNTKAAILTHNTPREATFNNQTLDFYYRCEIRGNTVYPYYLSSSSLLPYSSRNTNSPPLPSYMKGEKKEKNSNKKRSNEKKKKNSSSSTTINKASNSPVSIFNKRKKWFDNSERTNGRSRQKYSQQKVRIQQPSNSIRIELEKKIYVRGNKVNLPKNVEKEHIERLFKTFKTTNIDRKIGRNGCPNFLLSFDTKEERDEALVLNNALAMGKYPIRVVKAKEYVKITAPNQENLTLLETNLRKLNEDKLTFKTNKKEEIETLKKEKKEKILLFDNQIRELKEQILTITLTLKLKKELLNKSQREEKKKDNTVSFTFKAQTFNEI